jgi:hypothetical protein
MSDGNPSDAMYFWLSALQPSRKILKVSLPMQLEDDILSDLQDETNFVYAAVAKHENLTAKEAVNATDLPEGFVRYALKIGIEREFLIRCKKYRYRLSPARHIKVIDFLTKRNYLHAS